MLGDYSRASLRAAPQKLLRTPRRPAKAAGWTWTSGTTAPVTLAGGLPSFSITGRRPAEVALSKLERDRHDSR
jgi:hypothetical protein